MGLCDLKLVVCAHYPLLAVVVIRWVIDWIRTRVIPKIHANDVLFLFICAKVVLSNLFSPYKRMGFTSMCGYLLPMAVFA